MVEQKNSENNEIYKIPLNINNNFINESQKITTLINNCNDLPFVSIEFFPPKN